MLSNRLIPAATVIPVLAYPDVPYVTEWLCGAFGFAVRLRLGAHRVQLDVGEGAVILRELRPGEEAQTLGLGTSIMIRTEEVDAHRGRAGEHGATITAEPETYPYGERQYTVEDFFGRVWTFSQSVADVPPETWNTFLDGAER